MQVFVRKGSLDRAEKWGETQPLSFTLEAFTTLPETADPAQWIKIEIREIDE